MRLVIISMLCISAPLLAAETDVKQGQELHDANCVSCHAAMTQNQPDTLYTRETRRVTDASSLYNQVQRCALNLGLKWFDTEIADVTAYLNSAYYKFDTSSAAETPQK